mmetsp:Transcript_108184/g.304779  ORF Transcript_108184/g.304779 Transcript_108184/m.304779 type:complete len:274 (-) Transcript_108184:1407-2228(-)
MCKQRTLSCSTRAFFAIGSSAFSSATSKTPTIELARHAAGGAPFSSCRTAASCAMISDAALGCLLKPLIFDVISSSLSTAVELLSKARWCPPTWLSCTTSSSGAPETIGRGFFKSRSPNARVTATGSSTTPSRSGGAASTSSASSSSWPALAQSGCANLPSANRPSFPSVSLSSVAFFSASLSSAALCSASSGGDVQGSMPSMAHAQALGITAASTLPADARTLWSTAVAAESVSHKVSILSLATSTFEKASFACALNSSGALSGCTLSANFL